MLHEAIRLITFDITSLLSAAGNSFSMAAYLVVRFTFEEKSEGHYAADCSWLEFEKSSSNVASLPERLVGIGMFFSTSNAPCASL
jgi:hypothetical protein